MIFGSRRGGRPVVPVRPDSGLQDGLAYTLWRPSDRQGPPRAGVLVLHGAGSAKESHYDFARAAIALGFAALVFDQRGHGESQGCLDGRAVSDVVAMVDHLRQELAPGAPVALRGSSLGGYLALRATGTSRAAAVVAISPASPDNLRRALQRPDLPWRTDAVGLTDLLDEVPMDTVVRAIEVPILFMHAAGDEQVPVQLSRELVTEARNPGSRLIEVPGGHHRSVQHDHELQAVSLGFLSRELGLRRGAPPR